MSVADERFELLMSVLEAVGATPIREQWRALPPRQLEQWCGWAERKKKEGLPVSKVKSGTVIAEDYMSYPYVVVTREEHETLLKVLEKFEEAEGKPGDDGL